MATHTAAIEISAGSTFLSQLTPAAFVSAPAGLVGAGESSLMSVYRALHPVDEVAHAFESNVSLPLRSASGDHFLARVVFQRTGINVHAAVHELGFGFIRLGLRGVRHGRAVGRHLDEALFEAAAHQVIPGLALLDLLDVRLVHDLPIPLGAGEVTLGRQSRLASVITGAENPA